MTDQRDPTILAAITELAIASREAPTLEEIESRVPSVDLPRALPRRRRVPNWAAAVSTAAIVLVLIGGGAWLLRSEPTTPPAVTVAPTSAPSPAPTPVPTAAPGPVVPTSPPVTDVAVTETPSTTSAPTTTPPAPVSVFSPVWSRVPHDESVFGGEGMTSMDSVTAGGPGLVAIGSEKSSEGVPDAAVWTSVDGITWSRLPHDEAVFGGEQRMNDVTAGGPGLVAVGMDWSGGDTSAAAWTSVDGITWSRVPHNGAVFGVGRSSGGDDQWMASVTAGGPGLVAVGSFQSEGGVQGAAVWTSTDGVTWSRVPHNDAVFGGEGDQCCGTDQWMNDVTAGGPGLVAVGYASSGDDRGAAVWTSTDGVTWFRVPHDRSVFGGQGEGVQAEMVSVTAGGPGLVAVGTDTGGEGRAAVWTSVDGITWSKVPHDEAVFGEGDAMSEVTAGGPGLVAVGSDAVWTSVDGITWSRVGHDDAVFGGATVMQSVTAGGPGLVAVGRHDEVAAVWVGESEDS